MQANQYFDSRHVDYFPGWEMMVDFGIHDIVVFAFIEAVWFLTQASIIFLFSPLYLMLELNSNIVGTKLKFW